MSRISASPKRRREWVRGDLIPVIALFLGPTLIGLAIFQWLPLGVAIRNSLFRFSPLNPNFSQYVGLGNYIDLLKEERFQRSVLNTLVYIGGKLALQVPLGLGLALLLNRGLPGTRFVRGVVYAALVSSEAVVALLWNMFYIPDNGLFNAVLAAIGLPTQPFLISTTQALPAILAMAIWKDIGLTMLILLAGLQTIPCEYYEAASIDGANALTKLRFITIPLLKRMLLLATFMATITGLRIFSPVLLMTQGGPQNATVNIIYYIYEQAFLYQRMGEASTAAVFALILLIGISLIQSRLLRSEHEY